MKTPNDRRRPKGCSASHGRGPLLAGTVFTCCQPEPYIYEVGALRNGRVLITPQMLTDGHKRLHDPSRRPASQGCLQSSRFGSSMAPSTVSGKLCRHFCPCVSSTAINLATSVRIPWFRMFLRNAPFNACFASKLVARELHKFGRVDRAVGLLHEMERDYPAPAQYLS